MDVDKGGHVQRDRLGLRHPGVASGDRLGAVVAAAARPEGRELDRGGIDQRPLRFERQQAPGILEPDPSNTFELVIMPGEVAADGFHDEVVHGLVDPGAALHEGVVDGRQGGDDPNSQAGLLLHFADGRLLDALARVRRAFRERPGSAVAVTVPAAQADNERGTASLEANDNSAGGGGGGRPQARHGAAAALDRPSGTERDQVIETTGCGRPVAGRLVGVGVMDRAPARSRARADRSCCRRTVGRQAVGRKAMADRRPRRRSRLRVEARGNRAAGRAAYFAAMLCSIGRMVARQSCRARQRRIALAASGASTPRPSARATSRSAAAT